MKAAVLLFSLTMVGCGNSNNEKNTGSKSAEIQETENENDAIKIETKDYIQNAIDKANLIKSAHYMQNTEGEVFFGSLTRAYSYYGQNIKLYNDEYDLAVREDGSLWCCNTLVTDEYKIKDIIGNYLLTEDGHILEYYLASEDDCGAFKYNTLYENHDKDIVAGCACEEGCLFIQKDGTHFQNSALKEAFPIEGWENVVVIDCFLHNGLGTAGIAAIAGDGTVYAYGDYSEEILSWGELAYISMNEYLIVGLTKDGTIKITGEMADWYDVEELMELTGVEAVRVIGRGDSSVSSVIVAATKEGFYIDDLDAMNYVSKEKVEENSWKISWDNSKYMDLDGTIKKCVDGQWVETTFPKAVKGEADNFIYFYGLDESGTIDWRTMEGDYESCETDWIDRFMKVDVDDDGVSEVLLDCYESNVVCGVACVYNGEVRTVISDSAIVGYYPKAGIVVTKSDVSNGYTRYWSYDNGKAKELLNCFDDSIDGISYYAYEAAGVEKKKDSETSDDRIELTEQEFNKLLKQFVGNEKMQEISDDKWIENTEENRKAAFLPE